MRLKTMLIITAVLALVYGISYQLSPTSVLALYGVTLDSGAILMARLFGAAIIGIGLLTAMIRNTEDEGTQRAITVSMLAYSFVALVVVLHGTLSGAMSAVGWSGVGIFLFLTLGYGYLQVRRARASQPVIGVSG